MRAISVWGDGTDVEDCHTIKLRASHERRPDISTLCIKTLVLLAYSEVYQDVSNNTRRVS